MVRRRWQDMATRLRAMDAAEIASRLRQEFHKRAGLLRFWTGFTPHEEPRQPAAKKHFFFELSEIPAVLRELRTRLPQQVEAIVEEAERICAHQFHLLGYANVDFGRDIDWHLDAVHQVRSP